MWVRHPNALALVVVSVLAWAPVSNARLNAQQHAAEPPEKQVWPGRSATAPFTDSTLTQGTTVVKRVHIEELRTRVDALRVAWGLGSYDFSDATLTVGVTPAKGIHITDLRTALGAAYTAANQTLPAYTDSVISAGIIIIKADHIRELRAAVVTLESVPPPDTQAPTIAITAPTSNTTHPTSMSTLHLGGTASDNVEVTQVTWVNDRGGSGTASGTTSWSQAVTLQSGINVVTAMAHDAAGNTSTDSLTVTFTPPDAQAPTVTITAPTLNATYAATSNSVNLGGTASDNIGVVEVTWTNDRGGGGTASGTTNWSQSGIALLSGTNVLTVTARDAVGNTGTDALTVTYTFIPFGAGLYVVGTDINPGRYYTDPASGCYWERLSGFGGTFGEIVANEFIGHDAGQEVVDIVATDVGFSTDADCGTWFDSQRGGGSPSTIAPGNWVVGSQVTPGTYSATVGAGCYWERLRDFTGNFTGIIANDFVPTAGPQTVSINASDVGFQTDGDCGTWTRVSGPVAVPETRQSPIDTQRERELNLRQSGAPAVVR